MQTKLTLFEVGKMQVYPTNSEKYPFQGGISVLQRETK